LRLQGHAATQLVAEWFLLSGYVDAAVNAALAGY